MTAPIKTITKKCVFCGESNVIDIKTVDDLEGYTRWKDGEFIQVALWHWTAPQREALISGTHEKCWELFRPEDDDE